MSVTPPQPYDSTDFDSPTSGDPLQTLPGQFDFSNIAFTPTTIANAVIGVPYNQQFTISGGYAPYGDITVSSGNLPVGISLSSTTNNSVNDTATANISGTPTSNVTATFTLQSIDQLSNTTSITTTQAYTLTIDRPTITVTPATISNGVVGTAYTTTITATGGTTPYSWTTTNPGILGAGLSLTGSSTVDSTTGTVNLAGIPTANGTFNFAVAATDFYSSQGQSNIYTPTFTRPTITVTPSSIPGAVTGTPYTANITATGGVAPYTYSVTGNSLPASLTVSATGNNTGVISGIVINDVGQPFNFEITAYDLYNSPGNVSYSLAVTDPPITISPQTLTLTGGVVGLPYSLTFTSTANGVDTGPYTYSVTGGTLPANISLSTSGSLTGTPTVANVYSNITITSTDFYSSQGSRTYESLTTILPTIILDPTTLPDVIVRHSYSANVVAFGGTAPYTFAVTDGELPPGITFNSAGHFSGTPTIDGEFTFTITATDSYDSTGDQPYTLVVTPPPITISPSTIPNGEVDIPYAVSFSASGGTAPYTFSANSIPAGMSIYGPTGAFTGSPAESGYQPFTVIATDADGYTGEFLYNFVVIPNIPTSAIEVYVGGIHQTSGYTVTSKSPATVAFDVPPPAGVNVTIAVRQGVGWYQPGPYEPSDGQPLQETNTPAARFLRGVN